jgi:hypothetical protein
VPPTMCSPVRASRRCRPPWGAVPCRRSCAHPPCLSGATPKMAPVPPPAFEPSCDGPLTVCGRKCPKWRGRTPVADGTGNPGFPCPVRRAPPTGHAHGRRRIRVQNDTARSPEMQPKFFRRQIRGCPSLQPLAQVVPSIGAVPSRPMSRHRGFRIMRTACSLRSSPRCGGNRLRPMGGKASGARGDRPWTCSCRPSLPHPTCRQSTGRHRGWQANIPGERTCSPRHPRRDRHRVACLPGFRAVPSRCHTAPDHAGRCGRRPSGRRAGAGRSRPRNRATPASVRIARIACQGTDWNL